MTEASITIWQESKEFCVCKEMFLTNVKLNTISCNQHYHICSIYYLWTYFCDLTTIYCCLFTIFHVFSTIWGQKGLSSPGESPHKVFGMFKENFLVNQT